MPRRQIAYLATAAALAGLITVNGGAYARPLGGSSMAAKADDQETRDRAPYDLLDEDVVWTIVGRSDASREYSSKEAFMSDIIRPFSAPYPGV